MTDRSVNNSARLCNLFTSKVPSKDCNHHHRW